MRAVEIDWREALTYVTRDPAWKRRVGLGGLFMLIVPPLGWVLALGYRSLVGFRLVDRHLPVLPPWRGNFEMAFRRGAASSGVILGYLTPFLAGFWFLGVHSGRAVAEHLGALVTFITAVIALPPLAIPTLPVMYSLRYRWLEFSPSEIAILLIAFVAGIVLLPAAFLQVARYRRFRDAFNLPAARRLILAAPRAYAEAWIVSLAVSAVSVVILPLAPWLLFWSYLVISHLFLQVLARAGHTGVAAATRTERRVVL
jgi:hypothetical protein